MEDIFTKYIRVSEVLSRLRDRSNIHQNVLEEKARVGTEVHDNIYQDCTDGIPTFSEFNVIHVWTGQPTRKEKRGKPYFKSYKLWAEKNQPKQILMEKRLFCNELMITGQMDAVVAIDENKAIPVLLDYKTSYSADLEIWGMQAHLYWHLLKVNGIDGVDKFLWLQLDKDGKYPKEHWIEFDKEVLSRCYEETIRTWEEKQLAQMFD